MNSCADGTVPFLWIANGIARMVDWFRSESRGAAEKAGRCAVLWQVRVVCGATVRERTR